MRIRKHTTLIPAGSVVLDLDHTIIDAQPFYQEQAKRKGYKLTRAQCNYNVIKQHIPGDLLHEIDESYNTHGTRFCEPFPGALEVLREYSFQSYIATGRGTDTQRVVLSWFTTHLPTFPADHVLFYPTTAAKGKALTEFEIALAVDDQLGPLKALPESTVRLLFDPDEAFPGDSFAGLRLVRTWPAIGQAIASTVKPIL